MNHIWPRVLIAAMLIAGMITLLIIGSVSESAAFGLLGIIAGFFFGQFVPAPIEEPFVEKPIVPSHVRNPRHS